MASSDKKSGMSTTMKILLGLVITGGLAIALCCGGSYWFLRKSMKMTENPAEVTQLAETIAKFEVPEGYKPRAGMSMNIGVQMKMVAFDRQPDPKSGHLLFMQMTVPGQANEAQLKQSFDQQLKQQGQQQDLTEEKRETKTFQIDGQPREFEFITGVDKNTNKKMHMVTGTFPGRDGIVMFVFAEDDAVWDEARATRLIESISTKPAGAAPVETAPAATSPAQTTPAEAAPAETKTGATP